MVNLSKKRILVTGGHGFLGHHIVNKLLALNPKSLAAPSIKDCDLMDPKACERCVVDIDVVIHAAGKVGGIGANKAHPGKFFYENALMGIQLLEAARRAKVQKFIQLGSVCEYPKEVANLPFRETDLWSGYPEETNGPYGLAKKALLTMGQAYRQEYKMNVIHLLLVNMYGPGDHFASADSHVLPALIHRFWQAKQTGAPEVVCWGTGSPTREFLYVEDAASAVVAAAQKYDKESPINIGSGQEISIKKMAETIANIIGYSGQVSWDTSKPDGQPRRLFDVSAAKREFGFSATTAFKDGLSNTIASYEASTAKQAQELIQS